MIMCDFSCISSHHNFHAPPRVSSPPNHIFPQGMSNLFHGAHSKGEKYKEMLHWFLRIFI